MKICPTCQRTFTEEHLSYCTSDGTPLVEEQESSDAFDPRATLLSTPPPAPPSTSNYTEPPATQAYRANDMPGGWQQPQPYSWKEPSQPLPPPAPSWNTAPPPAPAWRPPPPPAPYSPMKTQTNPLAIASLALGVFSITLGLFCMGFVAAPVAIGLGIVALVQAKGNPAMGGKGMAIAGILTGGGSLLLSLLFVILSIALN